MSGSSPLRGGGSSRREVEIQAESLNEPQHGSQKLLAQIIRRGVLWIAVDSGAGAGATVAGPGD